METRTCPKCNLPKDADQFYFQNNKPVWHCKSCIRLKGKWVHGVEKPIDLPGEIWKNVPGFESLYQGSTKGRIKALEKKTWNGFVWMTNPERIIRPGIVKEKYLTVNLTKNGKGHQIQVAQVIAMTFLGHVRCGFEIVVDHDDDDTFNNCVENLKLLTNRENVTKGFLSKSKTSKYTGVYFNKNIGRWRASLKINGDQVHLGYFTDENIAGKTYQIALENIHNYLNGSQFRTLIKSL